MGSRDIYRRVFSEDAGVFARWPNPHGYNHRLEVAEFSAWAILNAAKVGTIQRIAERELDILRQKFGLS